MNKKILITGIAGMIGTVLSKYFLDKGYQVIGVDNLSEGYLENIDDRTIFYQGDICNLEFLKYVFSNLRPDYVINASAEAAEILSPFIRSFTYQSNIVGTANVINCCVNYDINKIIHFSSIARYGDGIPPFSESSPIKPLEPYGISKYVNELDLKEASEHFGLNYNVLVCFNVASKYQNYYSRYRNALAIFARQSVLGQDITLYGDGQQKRSFSDAQYICAPIEKLLLNDKFNGETYNLGSSKPITLLDAAQIVQKEANKRGFNPKIIHLEPRKEVKIAYCKTIKAEAELDFKDNTDLPKLVAEMFDYIVGQPIREIKKRDYEITKNLYSFWQ